VNEPIVNEPPEIKKNPEQDNVDVEKEPTTSRISAFKTVYQREKKRNI
jgi:hypothetical protein